MEWCEMGWVMRVGRNWVVWMVGERMLMEWDGIGRDGMGMGADGEGTRGPLSSRYAFQLRSLLKESVILV